MGRVTTVSPVPPSLALEFAGGRPFMRKVLVHQVRNGKAIAFMVDGAPAMLAMFWPVPGRRLATLGVTLAPAAQPNMLALIRAAQLTLRAIAQTGILVATSIDPGNRAGVRWARLTGWRHGRFADASIWLWKDRGS